MDSSQNQGISMLSKQSASIAYDVKGDCDNNILMGTASIDLSDLGRKKQMDSTYDIDMKEDSWIHAYPPYLSLSAYILKLILTEWQHRALVIAMIFLRKMKTQGI